MLANAACNLLCSYCVNSLSNGSDNGGVSVGGVNSLLNNGSNNGVNSSAVGSGSSLVRVAT